MGIVTVCYLVYVELVEIGMLCLWCSTLHVIILSLFTIEMATWWHSQELLHVTVSGTTHEGRRQSVRRRSSE
jgi:uncharacterized membrane protein